MGQCEFNKSRAYHRCFRAGQPCPQMAPLRLLTSQTIINKQLATKSVWSGALFVNSFWRLNVDAKAVQRGGAWDTRFFASSRPSLNLFFWCSGMCQRPWCLPGSFWICPREVGVFFFTVIATIAGTNIYVIIVVPMCFWQNGEVGMMCARILDIKCEVSEQTIRYVFAGDHIHHWRWQCPKRRPSISYCAGRLPLGFRAWLFILGSCTVTKYVVAASISNRVSLFSYPYVAQDIFDPTTWRLLIWFK